MEKVVMIVSVLKTDPSVYVMVLSSGLHVPAVYRIAFGSDSLKVHYHILSVTVNHFLSAASHTCQAHPARAAAFQIRSPSAYPYSYGCLPGALL